MLLSILIFSLILIPSISAAYALLLSFGVLPDVSSILQCRAILAAGWFSLTSKEYLGL